MKVKFHNSRGSKVWIAVMYYSPSTCGAYGNWETKGWWGVNPGATVYPFNTTNRYACFYGEGEDGALWTGPYGPMYVYYSAFTSCINIGSTAAYDVVGLRLIDLGSGAWNPLATHTVNLV